MDGPNPAIKHPMPLHTRVGFLKPLIDADNIEIGDFTYYDNPDGPDRFVEQCVLHHYPVHRRQADHRPVLRHRRGRALHHERRQSCHVGLLDLPVQHLRSWLGERLRPATPGRREVRGDTVIGNDVWIGMEAIILPGVQDRRRVDRGGAIGGQPRRAALFDRRRQSGQGGEGAVRRRNDAAAARHRLVELAGRQDHAAI